ncbi:protein SPO16 homolog [Lampris incognitus]|uniref:protein SPO16 homolog n=1 Tax=Lampris incognitus TaxID=2546036 RepID=UPI0024B60535|nr:protein SPO16 homolog [Lampris incognitus]
MGCYACETPDQWKTTIIVGTSFQSHDVTGTLRAQQHRLRFSDRVEIGCLVFPVTGIAFLVVDPQELPGNLEESELFEKIKKFTQIHRNSFLLLHAPFYGKGELKILSSIQSRFFGSNLGIIPVRNNAEMVSGILTIAKTFNILNKYSKSICSKPHVDSIWNGMCLARGRIIENSRVWEMLRDNI